MATIRDVAKLAGVSISTVSRVLNGYPMISDQAKEAVINAVNELEYTPNRRSSQRSKNKTILVVSVSHLKDITDGICDAASELGYNTLITVTNPGSAASYLKYVEDGLISGIILLNIRLYSELSESLLSKCPIVQCNEYENIPEANLVTIDNNGATREITEHLIHSGKKRLAFMSPQSAFGHPVKFAIDREYGFRQAIEQAGLTLNPDFVIRTDFISQGKDPIEYAYELNTIVRRLLTLPVTQRPDGIVCTSDVMAVCCMNVARDLGIKVPEELAVTAFDNTIHCALTKPQLTTVDQPYYEMGCESSKLLVSAIEGEPTISKRVLLAHKLVIRGSSSSSDG